MAGKKRFTIGFGFLTGYSHENYSAGIFKSVHEACDEAGLNFIGFEGGFSRAPSIGLFPDQKNFVIDLIGQYNLDGMILLAEHAANSITDAEMKRLFRNLSGVPVVTVGHSRQAAANVLVDNTRSMCGLVAHLLNDHGHRRIAFLCGPDTSSDGTQRLEAYKETLREYGVAVREKLIVYNGDYYSSGTAAVKTLLDERRADFDAIVAANDPMAFFAIRELERRGIRVPDDIAVTGFDDVEVGRRLLPGLTTIRQSFFDIGRKCVKTMRAILDGEHVPRRIVVPTQLVIRHSCGCSDSDKLDRILSRAAGSIANKKRPLPLDSADDGVRVALTLEKAVPSPFEKPGVRTAIEALVHEVRAVGEEAGKRRFFKRLEALFERLFESNEDLETVWQLTVSFFEAVSNDCADPARLDFIRELYKESVILAGLTALDRQSRRKPMNELVMPIVAARTGLIVNNDFAGLLDLEQLKETVSRELQRMPFKGFYVCLYSDSSRQTAKLLMQYHPDPGSRLAPDRLQFPANQLIPGLVRNNGCFAYLVAALFFNETTFGYILINITSLVVQPIYDHLAAQISNAINNAIQAKAIKDYAGKLEEKVQERTRQLELATRARADFFNDIAHEINNPLTIISNYLDTYIAKQGMSDDLKVLKTNFTTLLRVMEDYLSREKIESGKIFYRHEQITDLSGIVRNDAILFRESARRKSVRLEDAVDPDVFVAADPEALERVVGNLLQNAIRFTKPGGVVKVTLLKKKDTVVFAVKDTGVGLTSEQLKHIFERYYQAHPGGDGAAGSGVGLYIVKRILDELSAGIRVSSARGKGTTFTCTFARARGRARIKAPLTRAAASAVSEGGGALKGERGNVLFVEDNAELLAYLVEKTKSSFSVFQATNGLDALEKLKHIPKPNIIVSDVLMDDMDGYRFYEELMKDDSYRDIPFVFLTAVNTQTDRLKALNQGAVDYITKPFVIGELIAKITSNLRIQEALKKKNIYVLGSKVYRALEAQMLKSEDQLSDHDFDHINRLYAEHGISRKEIEVLSLLKLGLPHKQIAARLNISINTMRTHLAHIYRKCKVNSSLELFAKLKTL